MENTTRPVYHAAVRMDERDIHQGTMVFVPRWASGHVIGWDHARVSRIQPDVGNGIYYVVLFADGEETGYFGYSIQCGVCMGVGRSTCHQCITYVIDGDPWRADNL